MKPIIQNSKSWPRLYSCKFLEAGIVSYEDSNAGIALVKKETIDKMLPSFIGKPVCIDHLPITPDNYLELKAKGKIVGNVVRVWFCAEDGWFHADFLVETDEGCRLIDDEGYSVSCAYNVLSVQEGGLWHDIKFDGEITDGSFTHLALVEQPRYEESKITPQLPAMLVNGKAAHHVADHKKQEVEMDVFKLFRKKENSKEEVSDLFVEIDGVTVPLSEVLNSVAASLKKPEEKKNEKMMAKDDDVVDVNGHSYKIAELVNAYKASKKNEKEEETDEEKKKKEDEAKNAKEAEEKAAAEKKEAEEKENAKKVEEAQALANAKTEKEKGEKYFAEIHNARSTEEGPVRDVPMTRAERADKWAKRNKKV